MVKTLSLRVMSRDRIGCSKKGYSAVHKEFHRTSCKVQKMLWIVFRVDMGFYLAVIVWSPKKVLNRCMARSRSLLLRLSRNHDPKRLTKRSLSSRLDSVLVAAVYLVKPNTALIHTPLT